MGGHKGLVFVLCFSLELLLYCIDGEASGYVRTGGLTSWSTGLLSDGSCLLACYGKRFGGKILGASDDY